MSRMPLSAPYEVVNELAEDLTVYFQDQHVSPTHAYMSCLLLAGRLSYPQEDEWTDELGQKFMQDVTDLLGAYWNQGQPS